MATVASLCTGLYAFVKGTSAQGLGLQMMRWRVTFQGFAVIFFLLAYFFK